VRAAGGVLSGFQKPRWGRSLSEVLDQTYYGGSAVEPPSKLTRHFSEPNNELFRKK